VKSYGDAEGEARRLGLEFLSFFVDTRVKVWHGVVVVVVVAV
jgi:hypothetical protein